MKQTVMMIFAVLAAAGCWNMAQAPTPMRGSDVAAVDQAPDVKKYLGGKPGGQDKVARTFNDQPPVIPHAVENFDEISLEENQCLSCHSAENYEKKNSPKIGDSHFRDREGHVLKAASAARHNCLQCHVAQVDAPPLIGNDFKGDIIAGKK
ncbi:MAG: nitrate reductase cytochrome c-type subunit [Betaproteobacteria bacterium]|nr:nitrate reductase cytochrome c-type subunit [Betaproteobacteria bacterium]MCL2885868.1 nitrate reductase cytochrome c-type subunit [Betaproteobacteria bacterium]